ncbi:Arm DNA-binding domain-containing protein [Phocaeicola barnesiae]|uniref:Arm DNA-binding domain-containing protein n=1 Tax=Phocaeicola barnesiae TaxID=376804 RepID=UPI002670A414|nr:Arm DNA-binding domain-containing protein [Phocaeicola barnesiae]MBS6468584.1 hypothetical protein [Bacteroides sp.]
MSKSTFRILFYLRKNYLNKSGKAGIMIRLTVNGDMVQFSSKLDIEPSLWDTKAGKAAGNSVKARQMNSMLEDIRTGNEIAKLYADNKVDVIIYAVEKSLDSYKFNLLHCKQTFISQLKSGALGARTIDEGAMDEKSGMNFSEYMAILSGNTDLLDKAKNETLEREILQLQEIAGKTWKKEDELKQLKSELATLDRKIQLELAPKHEETPSQGQEQGGGQDLPKAENVPKPDDAARDYIRDHIIIGRPGIPERREGHGMKM